MFQEVIKLLHRGEAGATWVWDGKESLSHGDGKEKLEVQEQGQAVLGVEEKDEGDLQASLRG